MNFLKHLISILIVISIVFISACKQPSNLDKVSDSTDIENDTLKVEEDKFDDIGPKFSPDGKQVVFYSYRTSENPGSRIYIVNADGSNLRKLESEDNDGEHAEPHWSLDGTEIVYSNFGEKGSKLMIMNADGSNARTLVNYKDGGYHQWGGWDSDGEGFYFTYWDGVEDSFTPNIYHSRNGETRQITTDNKSLRCQTAQNGRIYFSKMSGSDNNPFIVYSSNTDGGDLIDLENESGIDLWFPAISSGQNLYLLDSADNIAFWSMDLNGHNNKKLGNVTGKKPFAMFYSLDHTGRYLAYNIIGTLGEDIHKLDIKTGEVTKLTDDK
ncbi:PD40 domain-containing protein [Fulvivirga lutimaris]|uniref:PD40 domain-containing protein n=1 Tax=Fulvivirga lutimaris TaxID=1819566 RepID=UPI0012BC03B3|nr:PD40 domain-containing protein [Fulvivirga lutimaris]MTI39848.1 hypothetical protein [Fulvivirga lutimaris]